MCGIQLCTHILYIAYRSARQMLKSRMAWERNDLSLPVEQESDSSLSLKLPQHTTAYVRALATTDPLRYLHVCTTSTQSLGLLKSTTISLVLVVYSWYNPQWLHRPRSSAHGRALSCTGSPKCTGWRALERARFPAVLLCWSRPPAVVLLPSLPVWPWGAVAGGRWRSPRM